jgi:hypothetical protein
LEIDQNSCNHIVQSCILMHIAQHRKLYFKIKTWFVLTFVERKGLSWLWSCGNWIYNLCNQCLSSCSWKGVLDTTSCDKVCQWLAAGRWFSPGTPVSFFNKTDCHDKTEILLKMALNTITLIFAGRTTLMIYLSGICTLNNHSQWTSHISIILE